jgi:glycosyltransferase involved in cell wall biosynthesis
MRILHVTDGYLPRLGGIERQVHDLARRQRQAGHDVEILTLVGGDAAEVDDLVVHRPHGRGKATRIRYFAAYGQSRLVLAREYDVVHVHASTFSPLAYFSAAVLRRTNHPTVMTVHSFWDWAAPIFTASKLIRRWHRWPVTWSSVSTVAAAPLQRMVGAGNPVALLPNGVDPSAWQQVPLAREPGKVVIAGVMRLAGRKRPRQFLSMLRAARAQVPASIAMEAVIIGDGPLRKRLQRYLNRHDMADWVTLAGRGDHAEIKQLFRRADFFVAPALLESFGIAALEARCAGLPVVAHSVSGIRDFIRHGREGLLATGDREMVSRIVELTVHAPLRERLSEHNRRVVPEVNWADVLRRSENLYRAAGAPVPSSEVALNS